MPFTYEAKLEGFAETSQHCCTAAINWALVVCQQCPTTPNTQQHPIQHPTSPNSARQRSTMSSSTQQRLITPENAHNGTHIAPKRTPNGSHSAQECLMAPKLSTIPSPNSTTTPNSAQQHPPAPNGTRECPTGPKQLPTAPNSTQECTNGTQTAPNST